MKITFMWFFTQIGPTFWPKRPTHGIYLNCFFELIRKTIHVITQYVTLKLNNWMKTLRITTFWQFLTNQGKIWCIFSSNVVFLAYICLKIPLRSFQWLLHVFKWITLAKFEKALLFYQFTKKDLFQLKQCARSTVVAHEPQAFF